MTEIDDDKKNLDIWLRYVTTVKPLESYAAHISRVSFIDNASKFLVEKNDNHAAVNSENDYSAYNHSLLNSKDVIQQKRKFTAEANYKKRMKKGLFGYEARIDLHGLTQEQAYDSLINFISENFQRNKRKLLIITGKGKFCYQTLESQGTLIKVVPEWLKVKPFSEMVSVIEKASHYSGGDGALYVVLKKQF